MTCFRAEDLVVRYRKGAPPALDGVSMEAARGELYAILGPNGSGKSTLMRALLGSVRPEAGRALVNERPADSWPRRALAREVGAVAQFEPMPFPIGVRELVAMGRYPHLGALRASGPDDRRAVEDALSRCDALDLAERMANSLSGGELQRVRIARALAQEPSALVLDEPTASLDIRHAMTVLAVLRSAADRGMTILLVTHDLNLAARFADRLLLLDSGRVAAEGTVGEVLRTEVLEPVYRWPLMVQADPATGLPRVIPLLAGPTDPSTGRDGGDSPHLGVSASSRRTR